jgi:hypothetical protein
LQQLDKFHLQLQLELGKGSAPYKEVIVEEALVRLLEQAQENPEELIAAKAPSTGDEEMKLPSPAHS